MTDEKLSKKAQRQFALSAARELLRQMCAEPHKQDFETALTVLRQMAPEHPERIFAQWVLNANNAQIQEFRRDWNAWRALERQTLRAFPNFRY